MIIFTMTPLSRRPFTLLGKVIQINDDASVPTNNLFVAEISNSPNNYVFSCGYRNHQGILHDTQGHVIFSNKYGRYGGDALSII